MLHKVFLAINLPDDIKEELLIIQKELADFFDEKSIKWTSKDNLHITIHFFGNKNDSEINNIKETINNLNLKEINLKISKISYGPDDNNPKMIWALLDDSNDLQNIKNIFSDEKLILHITLGKINRFVATDMEFLPQICQDTDIEFQARGIDLMESVGRKYRKISQNSKVRSQNFNF